MQSSNAYNIYKNNSVNFASKEQLLLMLVDGAVKFAKLSQQYLEEKNVPKAHENLIRTQDIFIELMATLDTEQGGAWTKKLFSVYEYIHYKLIQANLTKDVTHINEILPLIDDIRDMWYEAYNLSKINK